MEFSNTPLRHHFNRSAPQQGTEESAACARLLRAAKHDHVAELTKILGEFPVGARWEQNGRTALLAAAAQGNFLSVQLLLNHGAAPDGYSRENIPLHHAAAQGRADIAALLLHHGATADLARDGGLTPLMEAAKHGKKKTAELFLRRGASLTTFDDDGNAPLHIAVAANEPELVRLLLAHGAAIDLRNRDTLTPLMLAAETGALKAAGALLDAGADLRLENDLRETAPVIAANHGETDVSRGFAALVRERRKRDAAILATPFRDGSTKEIETKKPLRFKPRGQGPHQGPQ